MDSQFRLDASESLFFQRQLEEIDRKIYEIRYPQFKARQLIPVQAGIPEWARVYTWREYEMFGASKFIGNNADDLPRVDAKGTETSKVIKWVGDSYGYTMMDIKAAAKEGTPLEDIKARAARRAIETQIDEILSTGATAHNLQGILSLSNTTSYTVGTKAAGGLTWGSLAAPNATGDEVAADIMGIASKLVETTKGVWERFRIAMPIEQYNYAAQKRLSSQSDITALQFALKTSPFIESITPWHRCDTAGAGSTDRMVAFPPDPEVVAAIVPTEFTPMNPQQRNLEWVINCIASCGGVVCRYPVAVAYADGI